MDEIFKRCLLSCLNIDLWKSYLNYIKLIQQDQPNGRAEIINGFEFALQHIGLDISSTPIWQDYLNFLKEQTVKSHFTKKPTIDLFISKKKRVGFRQGVNMKKDRKLVLFEKCITEQLRVQFIT